MLLILLFITPCLGLDFITNTNELVNITSRPRLNTRLNSGDEIAIVLQSKYNIYDVNVKIGLFNIDSTYKNRILRITLPDTPITNTTLSIYGRYSIDEETIGNFLITTKIYIGKSEKVISYYYTLLLIAPVLISILAVIYYKKTRSATRNIDPTTFII
jgi:hypothetical protein